jgi:anti-anti-sigma factor
MVGFNTVLTIKEALTYKTCDELEKVFNQLTKVNRNRIVIDFRAVPFLDSEALELLLTMHESLVSSCGILKLFGLNGTCRDILITTRLVTLFHVYGDMPEALRGEA